MSIGKFGLTLSIQLFVGFLPNNFLFTCIFLSTLAENFGGQLSVVALSGCLKTKNHILNGN
jgi:hypothetical protein